MKLYRAGLAAGLIAGALALAACSSSGGNNNKATTPAAGDSTSQSSSAAAGTIECSTGKLNGSGSTAQTNAMDAWRKAYQQKCSGAQINYDSVGSGDGIAAFTDGSADFAGSDAALKTDEAAAAKKQCGSDPIDLPMVVGPIAVIYKLSGVQNLTLNGPTIAKIFTGKIKKWDDPAIKALNSGVNLPSTTITPFYRSDDSGTTFNFASYLAAAAPSDFTATPDKVSKGLGFAGQGRDGSQGVADAVTQTDGGIGYAEFSYAVKAGLPTAAIDSGSGPVQLSKDTASKAVSTAKIVGTGNDLSLQIDYGQKTPGAYPMVLVTYEIVCSKYKDSSVATFVKNFLNYTVSDAGQSVLPGLGYAPIPTSLAEKVKASIAQVS